MMMTTNLKIKFFWATIQKNFLVSIIKKTMLLLVITILLCNCTQNKTINVHALKTNTGWGYVIICNQKIYIKQTIIPVISEIKSFQTKSDALKVGNLVLQKLNNNLSPTVTKKDLILLDIKT
jgi:hypothetical protein